MRVLVLIALMAVLLFSSCGISGEQLSSGSSSSVSVAVEGEVLGPTMPPPTPGTTSGKLEEHFHPLMPPEQALPDGVVTTETLEKEVPNVLILSIELPGLAPSYAQAKRLNGQIRADYAVYLDAKPEDYPNLICGYVFPVCEIRYRVYNLNGIYEFCVFTEFYSALGSGVESGVRRYYYDTNKDKMLTETEFFDVLGYTPERIRAEMQQKYGFTEEEMPPYLEPYVCQQFFFDEKGTLIIRAQPDGEE